MRRFFSFFVAASAIVVFVGCGFTAAFSAPPSKKPVAKPAAAPPAQSAALRPLRLPQDASPHDQSAAIEWWYFNAFVTGEGGHKWAVVGSFFRTGLPGAKKGHYLIYSLIDLDANEKTAYSVLDKSNVALLKTFASAQALQNPSDPRPLQLLGHLKNDDFPPPHRLLGTNAVVKVAPLFSVAMENNTFAQVSPDARTWQANLSGDDWTLDLTLTQEPNRPPMLVGGAGRTGLKRPDDMAYLSLTHMEAVGTLTQNGVVDKVKGAGWVDRQWGTSWVAQNNGWDWWGVQLSDGSDLIVYRVKDNVTGKILRAEATLLRPDGTQIVEKKPAFSVQTGEANARWTDGESGITFPLRWQITLPTLGLTLTTTPAFPEQTIPVLGIGDAIWEGAVRVSGTGPNNAALTGQGFMELVGYKPSAKPGGAGRP